MTTLTLTSSEPRHAKALALLADRGQWLRATELRNGRHAVGLPSQRLRGLYHWTDGATCSCHDFRRRQLACKHVMAFRPDAIAHQVEPQPARDTVDGLTVMLAQRARRYDDIFKRFEGD